jgi:hypothetical protein
MPVFILGPVQFLVSAQPRLNSEPVPAGSLLRLARYTVKWSNNLSRMLRNAHIEALPKGAVCDPVSDFACGGLILIFESKLE